MAKLVGDVDPGVKDGERRVVYTQSSQKKSGGVPSVGTYKNQLIGIHTRSALLKSVGPPIHPLPYRVFAGAIRCQPFDYEYLNGTSVWRRYGMTSVSSSPGGFGVPVTYGTRLDAGNRVPDVSLNMVNQAITEALNDLQDGKMNILASIAEAREAIDLVATILSRILRSYRAARRGRWNQAYRIIAGKRLRGRDTTGSRAWLAWHYAVLPMLGDIQGAFALAHQGVKDAPVVSGHRFVSGSYGLPSKPTHISSSTWRVTGKCEVGVEVHLRARLTDPVISLLGQMGLYNPFVVAWELLPFSFVIDWLVPVGNALEALTADLGIAFHDGYRNDKLVSKFTMVGAQHPDASGILPQSQLENVGQFRTTMLSFPSPRLYIKSPFSTSHVISALALFAAIRG